MYTIPAQDICAAYALKYLANMSIQSEYRYYQKEIRKRRETR